MISAPGLPTYSNMLLTENVPLLWPGSTCSIRKDGLLKIPLFISCRHGLADVLVSPHSSHRRVRSKATTTAAMTESFAHGSEAAVPALAWLSDLSLLLRHLHQAKMAKTRFSRLIWHEGMPELYYYHEYGPDDEARTLLGSIWTKCSSRHCNGDTKGLLPPKLSQLPDPCGEPL